MRDNRLNVRLGFSKISPAMKVIIDPARIELRLFRCDG
jgi:hypothetical protein